MIAAWLLATSLFVQGRLGGTEVRSPQGICECVYEQYRWPCDASVPSGTCHLARYSPTEKLTVQPPKDTPLFDENGQIVDKEK